MKNWIQMALLFATLVSCSRFDNTEKEPQEKRDERIVVITKQYNEIIYALGAENDVVAVDISSTYPPEIKELPTIGYHRALSAEAVLAAKPTLIIHDNNIGPAHVVTQLEELKIPMKVFETKGKDIPSTKALIREMGTYFHKEEKAEALCNQLDSDLENALADVDLSQAKNRVLVVHFGQASNVFLVVTENSTAAKIISMAGGEMAVTGERGMKQLSAEVIAASNPDVIFLTDFGYDRLGSLEKIKELPGIAGTNAAANDRIYRIEEHDLIYMGPRTGKTVAQIHKILRGDEAL